MSSDNNLIVSLVTYSPSKEVLKKTLQTLYCALNNVYFKLYLIDNTQSSHCDYIEQLLQTIFPKNNYEYIKSNKNLGFGMAHNCSLSYSSKNYAYHLIVNPDVEIKHDALEYAIMFMQKNVKCGLLTPSATWPDGKEQRLCKRYPTLFDLLIRGFAPVFVKKLFQTRLAKYEMADQLNNHDVLWDPPIVSGCFMLFRTDVLQQLGGFDPRFFLYFEDFDISLRAGKISRIAYVPQVKVVHHGGHASRKGWRHIWMFGRSMVTFFNIHGWRWW